MLYEVITLIDATLGTVFVWLFAHMALHLGEGGIGSFMNADWVRERNFIQQLGKSTELRAKNLLRIIVYVYTLLSLSVIWRISPSIDNAWTSLMDVITSYSIHYTKLYDRCRASSAPATVRSRF